MDVLSKRHRWTVAVLGLLLVQGIFGAYSVFTSAAYKSSSISPLVYALVRDTIGSITLMSALWWQERRKPEAQKRLTIDYEDYGMFVLIALFGVWGAQGLSALALQNLSAVLFSAVEPTMPLVTLVVSIALGYDKLRFNEWMTWGKLAGIAISIVSAVLLVVLSADNRSAGRDAGSNVPLGIFIMVLQILMGGAYPAVQRLILHKYSPLFVAAWMYVIGTGLLLLSVITGATSGSDWQFSNTAIGAIVFSGIFASGVAYGLSAFINKITNPVTITAFMPVQTVVAAFFSWWFLGSEIHLVNYLGGAGVAVGLGVMVCSQFIESRVHREMYTLVSEDADKLHKDGEERLI